MIGLLKKYYWLIILVTLLISMGQTLFMTPWQDDNALFFKLAHIKEPAGFLGPGIFGERAYKYTAFFYYPIYLLFGHREFFYFTLGFLMYALATYVVYKLISKILSREAGYLGGFLYACGFVGSDSFIRLFNSVITSLSVILVSFFVFNYWKYFKENKRRWYLLSVFIFFLAAEFARARTHYLVTVPFLFELSSFLKKKTVKSILHSLLRMLPFLLIFYRYVIFEDYRSGHVVNFVGTILKGGYYQTFGFLSSLTNLVMPEWLTTPYFFLILTAIYAVCMRRYSFTFTFLTIIWWVLSAKIFINPALVVTQNQIFSAFIGGELLLMSFFGIFMVNRKYRTLYLFLLLSILISLISYSFYSPLVVYEKINRYLSHPFFFLVIFLSLIFQLSRLLTRKASLIVTLLIIAWGINNLIGSLLYQRSVILNRTVPVKSFYSQLKNLLPELTKGDVLYFDVADNARANFADAFSVAQMPETTAIAWRYGVDRYDFEMFTEADDLLKSLEKNPDGKFQTFFYEDGRLSDTTAEFSGWQSLRGKTLDLAIEGVWPEYNLPEKVKSQMPFTLVAEILARPAADDEINFPLEQSLGSLSNEIYQDKNLILKASSYLHSKMAFRQSEVTASSDWQDRVSPNLTDGNLESVWQADRLLWFNENQGFIIKTQGNVVYSKLVLVNAFSDYTPLEFEILASENNLDWKMIKKIKNNDRYPSGGLMVFDFPPQRPKYFKIIFRKTLNGDSPALSEIWLIPQDFSALKVKDVEEYLANPFGYVADEKFYKTLLEANDYKSELKVLWMNNKSYDWQKSAASSIPLIYDGKVHKYRVPILPGGTHISRLKFEEGGVPGKVTLISSQIQY